MKIMPLKRSLIYLFTICSLLTCSTLTFASNQLGQPAKQCQLGQTTNSAQAYLNSLMPNRLKDIVCPDGKTNCVSGQQCCQLDPVGTTYGCIPVRAVCCKNGTFCPPNNQCVPGPGGSTQCVPNATS